MLVISRGFTAFTALLSIVVIGGAHAQNQNKDRYQHQHQNEDQSSIAGSDVWQHAAQQLAEGRNTFRFDTFGDEDFWGGALRLHETIAGAENGGIGPGLSPKAALELGLKVDARALPGSLVGQLRAGRADRDEPPVGVGQGKLN